MDQSSWLDPILTVIDTCKRLVNAVYNYVLAIGSKYRSARFGWPGVFLYWLPLFDTDGIQSMHWNVSHFIPSKHVLALPRGFLGHYDRFVALAD
jgi:hypothetical protein